MDALRGDRTPGEGCAEEAPPVGCRRKGSFLWLLPVNRQSCNRFRLFLAEIPGNPGNGRPLRALRGVRPPQRSVVPGRGGAARIPRRGLKTRMGRGKRELPHPRRRRRRAVGYAEWPVEVPYSCGRRADPLPERVSASSACGGIARMASDPAPRTVRSRAGWRRRNRVQARRAPREAGQKKP